MIGIIYHYYDNIQGFPDVAQYSFPVNKYLNIHVSAGSNSFTFLPFAGIPEDYPNKYIFFTMYDARFRPTVLAHEAGH